MNITITEMRFDDSESVLEIYQQGIDFGDATLTTKLPTWEEWATAHHPHSRLVAKIDDTVVGWAAISPALNDPVYQGVAGVSVYVEASERGKGIGRHLLEALIIESEKNGIWTLESRIFPENRMSISLHESCGFVAIGLRKKLGKMRGKWRNVLFMERRSTVVGIRDEIDS